MVVMFSEDMSERQTSSLAAASVNSHTLLHFLREVQSESVFILACAGVVALQVVELSKTLEPSMSFFGQACCCDWLI